MPNALKYIVDSNGQKTSVLVPIKVWQDITSNHKKLEILSGIRKGLFEVKEGRAARKKLQTLTEFLK